MILVKTISKIDRSRTTHSLKTTKTNKFIKTLILLQTVHSFPIRNSFVFPTSSNSALKTCFSLTKNPHKTMTKPNNYCVLRLPNSNSWWCDTKTSKSSKKKIKLKCLARFKQSIQDSFSKGVSWLTPQIYNLWRNWIEKTPLQRVFNRII